MTMSMRGCAPSNDFHDVDEPHGLAGHVGLPIDLGIDRDQEVLAFELQAVTGIEHRATTVSGPFSATVAANSSMVRRISVWPRSEADRHLETGLLQKLRDEARVIDRIGQRGNRSDRTNCR